MQLTDDPDWQNRQGAPRLRIVGSPDDLGSQMVAVLERAARELLDVLTRSDARPRALIGRLHKREDAAWLAELLMDIESDPDDISGKLR